MAQPLVDKKIVYVKIIKSSKTSEDCIIMRYMKFSALKLFIAPNGYDNWANIKVVYFLLLKTLVASPLQNCDLDTYVQDKKLNF